MRGVCSSHLITHAITAVLTVAFSPHACSNWMLYRSTRGAGWAGRHVWVVRFNTARLLSLPRFSCSAACLRRPGRGGVAAHPGQYCTTQTATQSRIRSKRGSAKSDQTAPCESFSRSEERHKPSCERLLSIVWPCEVCGIVCVPVLHVVPHAAAAACTAELQQPNLLASCR